MFKFSKRSSGQGVVAISFDNEGIALAHQIPGRGNNPPKLNVCEFIPCSNRSDYNACIIQAVNRYNLKGMQCVFVLQPHEYDLYLVECPVINEAELNAAMLWQIRDYLNYSPEDAVIQVSKLPVTEITGKGRKVYVIAARRSLVNSFTDFIDGTGLELNAIDIPEFAMRNIIANSPLKEYTVGFLDIKEGDTHLTVYQENLFYISRYFQMGSNYLIDQHGSGELYAVHCDELILELQRSFDYCVSEFGINSPSHLLSISCGITDSDDVHKYLRKYLRQQVISYDCNKYMQCQEETSLAAQRKCLLAIGGSLRDID